MKLSFAANAFREYGTEESVEQIAAAGYDGVELLFDEPHLYPPEATETSVDAVRECLDQHGVELANCNAFMLTAVEDFHHPSFVEPDPSYRRRRIDYTLASLETAAALDAPHISIEPGGPVPEDKSHEWALDTFESGLREVAARAEEVGVDVLVEPEPELLIESSGEFLELMERVDSPRIGCNFDAGHFYCVGEDPAALIDRLAPYTEHYHIEDIPADRSHQHTQLGDGSMDVDGFLTALDDRGYDGFVTVELYPYEETAVDTARDAMAYLSERGWA